MTEPVCINILFCDVVISEANTGKISYIGTFPGLGSSQFPLQIPRFFVAVTLGNVGKAPVLNVAINIQSRASGAAVASVSAQMQRVLNPQEPPFGVDLFDLYLPFINVNFPVPELYDVVVLVNGEVVGKRPFPMFQISMNPQAPSL